MRHLFWTLLTLSLCMPTFGQSNPHTALHDALVLENRGNFETSARLAKAAIDSRQLSGNELGRGYIILAVACQGAGDLANAQIAFEHALKVLEHDREHPEDYASGLENYAGFYSELGQPDVAAPMLRKAFHLRQRIGDHTGTALSLTRLAELALARNRLREAHRYLQKASNEAKASSDLIDDDKALFFETQGWLAIAEHNAPAAVAAYQHALEMVERSRGGQHWLDGWEHMLLAKHTRSLGVLGVRWQICKPGSQSWIMRSGRRIRGTSPRNWHILGCWISSGCTPRPRKCAQLAKGPGKTISAANVLDVRLT
jgi:tetratricopeptide (TPR) repeat protein